MVLFRRVSRRTISNTFCLHNYKHVEYSNTKGELMESFDCCSKCGKTKNLYYSTRCCMLTELANTLAEVGMEPDKDLSVKEQDLIRKIY